VGDRLRSGLRCRFPSSIRPEAKGVKKERQRSSREDDKAVSNHRKREDLVHSALKMGLATPRMLMSDIILRRRASERTGLAGQRQSGTNRLPRYRISIVAQPGEHLLADHVFSFFGRTITITSQEQLLAILALAVVATAWGVQLFRRRRSVVVQRSAVVTSWCTSCRGSRMRSIVSPTIGRPGDFCRDSQAEESRGILSPSSARGARV